MKITSEIFQVGGGQFSSMEDAAIYLINFNGHAAVIDSGCGRSLRKVLNNISACDVRKEQIEYLLLTHCHFDHTGGAKDLRDMLGCEIIAHELDSVYLAQGDNTITAASWYGASIEPFTVEWMDYLISHIEPWFFTETAKNLASLEISARKKDSDMHS